MWDVIDKLNEAHTKLSKTSLSQKEYQPISALLIEVKEMLTQNL